MRGNRTMMNDLDKQRGDAARGEPAGAEAAMLFRGLAKMVYDSDDFHEVYNALCRSATTLVTGCDHASLMLLRGDRFATVAASDDIAEHIDGLERELSEGPCVDSIEQEAGYVEPSLPESSQWPELTRRIVAETPVRGVAGFRLLIDNQKVGALNLFSDTPGGLTAQSVNEAAVVTSFVSIALMAAHGRHAASSLRDGLESNREIGKAIGLMMAFHKVDDRAAFEMLRRASQDMNVKLAEVAREFVAHHNARRG